LLYRLSYPYYKSSLLRLNVFLEQSFCNLISSL